jgi:hypothetical protein
MSFSKTTARSKTTQRLGPLSDSTAKLLNQMMADSKLNAFQQRQIRDSVKNAGALPAECPPEAHIPDRDLMIKRLMQERNFHVRPVQGRKTLNSIERDTPAERDTYVPRPAKFNREKEKDKLATAFLTKANQNNILSTVIQEKDSSARAHASDYDFSAMAAWTPEDELERQIEERASWLREMRSLKTATKEHETVISAQIAEKVLELKKLDPNRAELVRHAYDDVLVRPVVASRGKFPNSSSRVLTASD